MKALKIVSGFVALSIATILGSSVVFAASPGQLTGGSQVLEAKNITKGTGYSDNTSLACGEVVQYSVMLHNAGYGALTNVIVKASLPGSVSAVPAEGSQYGTSDTTSVNVATEGTLQYQSGTTVLYNVNGGVIKTLPDSVTSGGVNIGTIDGSTTEFVNYRAKVSCPTTPPPVTPPAPQPKPTPKALPNTGPGDMLGAFAGASTLGTLGHYFVSRRRK